MEDLKSILLSKADKSEITELHAKKCNKVDQELSWGFIETMHKQLAHIAVILKEMLKTLVQGGPTSEMEKVGRFQYLCTQSENVCGWIDKFN